MTKKQYGKDGIGEWSEKKLECVKKYLWAYSLILHHAGYSKYYFLDLFASAGMCACHNIDKVVPGSPLISLDVRPPFSKYYFFEIVEGKVKELKEIKQKSPLKKRIEIIEGDCNLKIKEVLKEIASNVPFIALLDPQAGDLYWETVVEISKKDKAEVLINFPFGMAINRYMPLSDGSEITKEMQSRLNQIFGNEKWQIIYKKRRSKQLSSSQAREKYFDLYAEGLESLGYKYWCRKDLKNSKNVHLYYLIFATKKRKGLEKMRDNFVKDEPERGNMFFRQDLRKEICKNFKSSKNISLDIILEDLLSGKSNYRVQDFKEVLKILEKEGGLVRVKRRKGARSFNNEDLFNII